MAEYIKKALVAREIRKLLRVRESAVDIFQTGFEYGVNRAWVKINNIPAADVAQVAHGRWVYHNFDTICSECRKSAIFDEWEQQAETEFCPHCGAKMDGEVNDENI